MIRLLWTASAEVRYFLRRNMPSNVLLDLIRTRKGLKWGVPEDVKQSETRVVTRSV